MNQRFDLAATDQSDDALELLDRGACMELLAGIDIGRLAWNAGGSAGEHPGAPVMVFPLNFAVAGDDIVMRTSSGAICSQIAASNRLTFQADDFEPAVRCGWTVLATGRVEEVSEASEANRLSTLVHPWRGENNLRVLRMRIESMTGRRLATRPGVIEKVRIDA